MDAYSVIFADPLAWLADGSVDYLVPQLYWRFGGPQDFEKLANWWASEIGTRHLYVGHGLYRAIRPPSRVRCFRRTRYLARSLWQGHVGHCGQRVFRAKNITEYYSQDIFQRLRTDFYRHPALTPTMPFKDLTPPILPPV